MIRYPNDSAPDRRARVLAVVVAIATALVSGYFMIAGLVDPGGLTPGGDTPAARTYAGYSAARGAVLLGAMLWFAVAWRWTGLGLMLALNGLVQVLDTVVGAVSHDVAKTVGPSVFAVALFLAAVRLLAKPGGGAAAGKGVDGDGQREHAAGDHEAD